MVLIADYELCRQGRWTWSSVRAVHQSEIHFPAEPEFPWAIARETAIRTLRSAKPEGLEIPEAPPLPFDIEAGRVVPGHELPDVRPERRKRGDFNITKTHIRDHGGTDGCPGCDKAYEMGYAKHNDACRLRFAEILGRRVPEADGLGSSSSAGPVAVGDGVE